MAFQILVVDDDDLNREVMEAFLMLNGYDVTMTGNGKRAIEMVSQESPDLVVLDLRLPDMSGIDVSENLKKNPHTQAIPILMITGMSDPKVRQEALSAGVDQYLQRPFDGDDFVAEVQALLSSTRTN